MLELIKQTINEMFKNSSIEISSRETDIEKSYVRKVAKVILL